VKDQNLKFFSLTEIRIFSTGVLLLFLISSQIVIAQEEKKVSTDPMGDWSMIEKEYKALRADRDNVLAQVKVAYDDKNKVLDELREVKTKIEKLNTEKAELAKKIEILDKEKTDLDEKFGTVDIDNKDLAGQVESLQKLNSALAQENDALKNQPTTPAAQVVSAPKSLMDAVKQRDGLIRENADMHYNLGVLLSKNQDFRNAAIEFTRAIELRKDDASSYFNLGKIYADFYKDNVKAVEYFKKYLEYNPRAEDRGWVESFITSIKAFRGEEKIS